MPNQRPLTYPMAFFRWGKFYCRHCSHWH